MSRRPLDSAGRPPLRGQLVVPGAGAAGVGEVLEVGELARRAAQVAGAQRSPATRRTYLSVYRRFGALAGSDAGLGALTPELVREYRDVLEGQGVASATVAKHLAAIRTLAADLGADPGVAQARGERVERGTPRELTELEAERLLRMPDRRSTAGLRDLAIMHLMLGAGLRREEVARLPFDALEQRRRHRDPRMRMAVAESTAWPVRVRGKRGRERIVPLPQPVADDLAVWAGRRPGADTDRLFCTLPRTGRPPRGDGSPRCRAPGRAPRHRRRPPGGSPRPARSAAHVRDATARPRRARGRHPGAARPRRYPHHDGLRAR